MNALIGFSVHNAHAFASEPVIRWSAPPGCPSEVDVRRGVEELLRARASSAENSVDMMAIVQRTDDSMFVVHLTLSSGDGVGERRFSGHTCHSVANAVMLITALAVDASEVAQNVLPTSPATQEPLEREDELHLTVAARAAGDYGSLPGWTAGLGLALSIELSRGWFEADLTAWLPRVSLDRTSSDDKGGEIGLASAGLRLCPIALRSRSFVFGPSVGAELGVMYGSGTGLAHPRAARGLWGAAALGLVARSSSQRGVFVQVSMDGLVALRRPSFAINQGNVIYQSQRFAARASISAGWRFP